MDNIGWKEAAIGILSLALIITTIMYITYECPECEECETCGNTRGNPSGGLSRRGGSHGIGNGTTPRNLRTKGPSGSIF